MQVSNPHRITLPDLLVYLDTLAIKEETQLIVLPKTAGEFERSKQLKKTRVAQLLLRIAKKSAFDKELENFTELIQELNHSNE